MAANKKYSTKGQLDIFEGSISKDSDHSESVQLKGAGIKKNEQETSNVTESLNHEVTNIPAVVSERPEYDHEHTGSYNDKPNDERKKGASQDHEEEVGKSLSLTTIARHDGNHDQEDVRVENDSQSENTSPIVTSNRPPSMSGDYLDAERTTESFFDKMLEGITEYGRIGMMQIFSTVYDDDTRKRQEKERKEQAKHERQERARQEKMRKESERQERKRKEREERERQERERRRIEFERQERERIERERKAKELREKEDYENILFSLSEKIEIQNQDKSLVLFSEKKEGLGEDALPLLLSDANNYVGVFDGMGGAGAAEYPTFTKGLKTGAYLASRVVRALCLEWLSKYKSFENISDFENYISKCLSRLIDFWNIRQSGLRSSFVRILPTTLAIVESKRTNQGVVINSLWAGDSRNYILLSSGLQQISTDDLRQPKDPLENLRNDDALSNCICQDKPFTIHKIKCGVFYEPIIILSATDGCFGYLTSPMHFEFILLDALMKSQSCKDWCDNIKKALSPISGDDFTLALQIIDGDFTYWQETLRNRYTYLRDMIIEPIERMKVVHEEALKECKIKKEKLYNGITDLWNQYKLEYLNNNLSYQK